MSYDTIMIKATYFKALNEYCAEGISNVVNLKCDGLMNKRHT